MVARHNYFSGTPGAAITTGNSGDSGDAFDSVAATATPRPIFTATDSIFGATAAMFRGSGGYLYWSGLGSLTTPVYVRAFLMLPAALTGPVRFLRARDSAGGTVASFFLNYTGSTWQIMNAAGSAAASSTTAVPLGKWVRIEGFFTPSATVGAATLKVWHDPFGGGAPDVELSVTNQVFGASIDRIEFGTSAGAPDNTTDYLMDGVGYDTARWIGLSAQPSTTQTARTVGAVRAGESSAGSNHRLNEAISTATSELVIQFSDPATVPLVDTDHYVDVNAKVTAGTGTMTLEFRQGSTVIESWTQAIDTTFTTYSRSLSSSNVANITNYDDLNLRITVEGQAGAEVQIANVLLRTPYGTVQAEAGSPTATALAVNPGGRIASAATVALAVAAALNPSADVQSLAGVAAAGATSPTSRATIATGATTATATAAAIQPTPNINEGTKANATAAAATAIAVTPTVTVRTPAGLASGVGAANAPNKTVAPNAGVALAVAAALGATVQVRATAQVAASTGTSPQAGGRILTFPAGTASAAGAALAVTPRVSPTPAVAAAAASAPTVDKTIHARGTTVAAATGTAPQPAGLATQVIRPVADVLVTGWVNELGAATGLWASLDEAGVNDADYVTAVMV